MKDRLKALKFTCNNPDENVVVELRRRQPDGDSFVILRFIGRCELKWLAIPGGEIIVAHSRSELLASMPDEVTCKFYWNDDAVEW